MTPVKQEEWNWFYFFRGKQAQHNVHCTCCGKLALLKWRKQTKVHYYECPNCKASVGCHKNSTVPRGIFATQSLRNYRKEVHKLFDSLWRSKIMERNQAYNVLAWHLQIPRNECHFVNFDKQTCKIVASFCNAELTKRGVK